MSYHDPSREIFSAVIGSLFCCYTSQPLDTIKVRIQTNPSANCRIIQTGINIIYREGLAALWKGSIPSVLGMVAENTMVFGLYEEIKRKYYYETDNGCDCFLNRDTPNFSRSLCLGSFTGICSAFVLNPSEVIKAKIQTTEGFECASSIEIIKRMIGKHGIKSLFCGLDSQIIRDGVFYAAFFGMYEMNCHLLSKYFPSIPKDLNYFLSGGLSGTISWILAMPFDVPKTNIQARWCTSVVGSYLPEILRIKQERGFTGFYKGLTPALIRAFPANAALFLGVETGKKWFDKYAW